jgi:hypothetical protein
MDLPNKKSKEKSHWAAGRTLLHYWMICARNGVCVVIGITSGAMSAAAGRACKAQPCLLVFLLQNMFIASWRPGGSIQAAVCAHKGG